MIDVWIASGTLNLLWKPCHDGTSATHIQEFFGNPACANSEMADSERGEVLGRGTESKRPRHPALWLAAAGNRGAKHAKDMRHAGQNMFYRIPLTAQEKWGEQAKRAMAIQTWQN